MYKCSIRLEFRAWCYSFARAHLAAVDIVSFENTVEFLDLLTWVQWFAVGNKYDGIAFQQAKTEERKKNRNKI